MIDLERMRPLVEIMAAERRVDPSEFDDAVQEGLIAAWAAFERQPDKPMSYYHGAARFGVMNIVRRRAPFGAASHRGKQDAADTGTVPLMLTNDEGDEFLVAEGADPKAEAVYDVVDISGAIHEAVASLPQEDAVLVHGRYWEDLGFRDLAARLGRPEGTLSRRWTQIIRPALAERLADVA